MVLLGVYLGYRMGTGDPLKPELPVKGKAVVRTDSQLDQAIERQSRKLDDRYHKGVLDGRK